MNAQEPDNWREAEAFVDSLCRRPDDDLFNPWHDYCALFDISLCAPQIRRQHLLDYFRARRYTAQYLFIGEALSFNGGRFSGIAMTSERMLNNRQTDIVRACQIIPDFDPQHHLWRTSNPDRCNSQAAREHGRIEQSATAVWRAAEQVNLDPSMFVLWNAVPWHPYILSTEGIPKNRPNLTECERRIGRDRLSDFLDLFPDACPIPFGRIAEIELCRVLCSSYIPHPRNAGDFYTAMREKFEAGADSSD